MADYTKMSLGPLAPDRIGEIVESSIATNMP